jgi:urea transporter
MIFSRDPRVGLLILSAIATRPWLALASVASVVLAQTVAWRFGLGQATVKEGTAGTSAALSVIALGALADPREPVWMLALAAMLAVVIEAAFETMLSGLALPTHSLPFLVTTWVIMLASRTLPGPSSPWDSARVAAWLPRWATESGPLDVLASLLFLNGALAGALVLLAIALHSRIALVLAALGMLAAVALHALLRSEAEWTWADAMASYNAILTATALGGVWFIPALSSLLLAAFGAVLSGLLTYALLPVTGAAFLPVLSLPFVLTTHLFLLASRRREADRSPSTTIPADRPEDSLARHLMRVRRFGDATWLPFRLPFRGEWVVTQGHDGAHTHQGIWRYGLDFEVAPAEHGRGKAPSQLQDYACYGLPVLAAGAGTVVSLVDGIEDNRPGEINTREVWGNVVVISHGVGLFSAYAHLQPRSILVRPGEVVTAGKEIARCGSSGRSPVPHLHFQLQRSSVMGSATLPVEFGDVVRARGEHTELEPHGTLTEGDVVRPVARDEQLVGALGWSPGVELEISESARATSERIRSEVDLLGRRSLVSERGRLWFESYEGGLVLLDFQGQSDSLLRLLLLALPRVPFDRAASLVWNEQLPRRLFLPAWVRSITDILTILGVDLGADRVDCTTSRRPGTLVIESTAAHWKSRSEIALGGSSHVFELSVKDIARVLRLGPARSAAAQPSPVSAQPTQESMT